MPSYLHHFGSAMRSGPLLDARAANPMPETAICWPAGTYNWPIHKVPA